MSELIIGREGTLPLVTVRCWFHMERRTLFYCELDQSQMGYVELPNNSITVEVPLCEGWKMMPKGEGT